jgi:hypothetical protein
LDERLSIIPPVRITSSPLASLRLFSGQIRHCFQLALQESNFPMKRRAKPDGLFRCTLSVSATHRANRRTSRGHALDHDDIYDMMISRTYDIAVDTKYGDYWAAEP